MSYSQKKQKFVSIDGIIPSNSLKQKKTSIRKRSLSYQVVKPVSTPEPFVTKDQAVNSQDSPAQLPERAYRASINPKRNKQYKNSRWTIRRKILVFSFTVLFIGFGIGTWYGEGLIHNVNKAFHGNVFSDAHALFSNTKLKGEDQGRVNILLAGDSADDPNHGGADLTDSIMIVSIDTKNHTGFMLSIPRDLWVNIPGWSHQKINAANDVTNFNQAGYPTGGMGQLEQIVQDDLGIPVDYYALINYTAFRDAVNAVGGITINIQSGDPMGIVRSQYF